MNDKQSLHKHRNIGIVAHIDAGKTTLTERLLYITGEIHKIGEVHEGKATMDFLHQEKERGITILAASTRIKWNDTDINIIDTPGHIDFNIEVERSLRVLDGAVIVIDSSAGVESQTQCVWRQAEGYNVSRIFFFNKMDKAGANLEESMQSVRDLLTQNVFCCHAPIFIADRFMGFYDLVTNEKILYHSDEYTDYTRTKYIDLDENERKMLLNLRNRMMEEISYFDEEVLDAVLNNRMIESSRLKQIIRALVVNNIAHPVFIGSAFKNKGVTDILDAIVDYLPHPDDRMETKALSISKNESVIIKSTEKSVLGFVFKSTTDRYLGAIYYVRLYNGTIKEGDLLICSNRNLKRKVLGIYRFYANDKVKIDMFSRGDIAAIVAEKLYTGDTLTSLENKDIALESIRIPERVVEMAIIPKTKEDQDRFSKFIHQFLDEDPTLGMVYREEQNEIVLSGVGKLQLEILVDRLRVEKNVQLNVSQPKISYRETITKEATIDYLHKKQSGGSGQFAGVKISISPIKEEFRFINKIIGGAIPREFIPEIENTARETLNEGILLRSKVIGVSVTLLDGKYHEVDSNSYAYSLATRYAIREALKNAECILLEPIMKVIVNTPEEFVNRVSVDIVASKGEIESMVNDMRKVQNYVVITASIPLRSLFDYADNLRSITKGLGYFNARFDRYRRTEIPSKSNT